MKILLGIFIFLAGLGAILLGLIKLAKLCKGTMPPEKIRVGEKIIAVVKTESTGKKEVIE